ncbi:MAG: polysaccharide pyruvyl transferase family protein [Gammaproteobacteria bacterium]|nr:polysaccharide pyruvyl transferase family protein [Gammaproteobacteria bacterium]MDH5653062.1 polysaccharide pyruvyl transferase family protein [Gammaproteobacteria bacterium]
MPSVMARWCRIQNWGDRINPELIHKISGKSVEYCNAPDRQTHFLVCGSIAAWATGKSIIYGAGCLTSAGLNRRKNRPHKIIAVRGALTRAGFLKIGVECPEQYGDAGLLYSLFYKPVIEKKYEVGIIPHYVDYHHPWLVKYADDPQVKIIDIRGDIEKVIDDVVACEMTISSSLHGIVCSNSYNVPSLWVDFGGKILGNGFKFRDYWTCINYSGQDKPVIISQQTRLADVTNRLESYKIDIDLHSMLALNPF